MKFILDSPQELLRCLVAHRQPATDAPTDGTEPVKIHEKCRGRSDHADPRGL